MADNTINIKLEVNDGGQLADKTKRAKELNDQLRQMSTGTQTGNRAVAASTFSNQAYTQAGGVTGRTGAGARDFAAESQGLGGLVRLYATYAANLFAVTAAFSALKDAMATTNMIEGLNQLGAQSGQSLGTLAKNFADASGGAISLKDAMQATVQATSAGLSTKQFSQLGEVAKKASLALGRDMSDSVSRLTRAVTKLEPELIDELGLFTKAEKSYQDYARSVGKTVEGLTDFEKRQAYANAVLKEGLDKFGSIDIPANPYDKLVASLKDLAQTGLAAVNTVLGPLIKTLSESPGALTAAIAALAAMLVKQALPAIGQYRSALLGAAEDAKKGLEFRAGEAGRAVEASAAERERALDIAAEKEKKAVQTATQKISEVRDSGFSKSSKAAQILAKDTKDVTQAELDYLTKVGKRYENQGKDDIAARYNAAVTAITNSAKAEKAYADVTEATTQKLIGNASAFDHLGQTRIAAQRAADIYAQKSAISNAAENTSILGITGAWKELNKEIKASNMGPIRSGFTYLSGAIAIAQTALVNFIGAIQTWLFIIGAVVAGAKLLDSWMTSSAEQFTNFNKAIDASNDAIANYDRTLKAYAKGDGSAVFSAAGIGAQANAFKELGDGIDTLVEKFKDLSKAQGRWDKFWDGVFGKSSTEKFAQNAVTNISKQLAGIDNQNTRNQATSAVQAILGVGTDSTQSDWIKALVKQGPEAADTVESIEKAVKKTGMAMLVTASRSKEFEDSLKKLTDSYKDFTTSVIDKSPMSKLGDDMVSFATKTVGALSDAEAGLGAMNKLLQDSTKLGMFSPDVFAQMAKMKTEVEDLNKQHGSTVSQLRISKQELVILTAEYDKYAKVRQTYAGLDENQLAFLRSQGADLSQLDEMKATTEKFNNKLAEISQLTQKDTQERKKIAEIMNSPVFKEMAVESFKIGADLITKSLSMAFEKASIDLKRGIISALSDLPGSGTIQRQIDQQDFAIQRAQLDMSAQMLKAQYLQIAAITENTAAYNLQKVKEFERTDRLAPSNQLLNAESMVELSKQYSEFISTGGKKGAKALVNNITKAMKDFGAGDNAISNTLSSYLSGVKSFQEVNVARAGINTKDELSKVQLKTKLIQEQKTLTDAINTEEKTKLSLEQNSLNILGQQNAFQTESLIAAQKALDIDKADQEYQNQIRNIAAETARYQTLISDSAKAGIDTTQLKASSKYLTTIKEANNETTKTIATNDAETKSRLALINLIADEEMRRLSILQIITETNNIRSSTTNELNDLELQYLTNSEKLSEQQVATAKYKLETTKLQSEGSAKLANLEINYLKEVTRLTQQYVKAAPGAEGDKIRADAAAQMSAIGEKYTVEVTGVQSVIAAKQSLLDLDNRLSVRQKAYADVFKKTFESMGDAIADFTKTGKLDFTGLIDSMLMDLLRYELRLQMMALYQAMRPQLMAGVSWMGGGVPSNADVTIPMQPGGGYAKGGVFDAGLQMFAKGGAFTNKIINSPTLFANGAGLMGEAGPEAIMPLKRDSSGNLGVRSNGNSGNVDVVVNNYGNDTATATETVDSRGNRRIEVTIGDLAAGEMSRSGSASQRSLRNTFGLQPQLIRR
jgi:lambda family phage tail tape measure protein